MRRTSHAARTVALGIIADDIFGALMNASSAGHDAIPPAWMIANRPQARPAEIRLPAYEPPAELHAFVRR
jgi:hypothetical protein